VNALKDHCCNAPVPQQSKLARIVNHVSAFLIFRTIGFTCLQSAVNAHCPLTMNLQEVYRECSGLAQQYLAMATAAGQQQQSTSAAVMQKVKREHGGGGNGGGGGLGGGGGFEFH